MITLYANGHPQCELKEIERFHKSDGHALVTYELSSPIEFVQGITYEIGEEGMMNRKVEPTSFRGEVSRAILKLV